MKIIEYSEKYRDDMLFCYLSAKDAIGKYAPEAYRAPVLKDDLLDVEAHYIAKGDKFWLAIDDDNRVAGMIAAAVLNENELRLHRLFIKPDKKRHGTGSKLLDAVEKFAASNNIKKIYTRFALWYQDAEPFYTAKGFKHVRTEKHLKTMAKNLTASQIVNMVELSKEQLLQAAQILTDELPLGWGSLKDAMEEIDMRLFKEKGNTLLAAVKNDAVLGFVGILPHYNGKVYEIHPLAVRRDVQGRGIGTTLVAAIEDAARGQGGLTVYLGTDDEKEPGQTSLANVDLYDNFPNKIANFAAGDHQAAFYLKMGYAVVGVVPDANGRGKPDIMLAKKLL